VENNSTEANARYWAIVPAAGVGARMGSDRPKQYLPLAGRTVIEQSLDCLLNHPEITAAVVAISRTDGYWADLAYQHTKPTHTAPGGTERFDSVLNALHYLHEMADDQDWVLVHDAARPCLRQADISRLMEQCKNHSVGGILAVPVKDTIKLSVKVSAKASAKASTKQTLKNQTINKTVDREPLWHAQTPQMFRLGPLRDALLQALADGVVVTDEASAMEHVGQYPLLIEGHADNLKITRPEDLPLAEFYFSQLSPTST